MQRRRSAMFDYICKSNLCKPGGLSNFCPPVHSTARLASPQLAVPPAQPLPPAPAPLPEPERDAAPGAPLFGPLRFDERADPNGGGLLCYQGHWYLSEVDVKVQNELLSGTPIALKGNTLCLINKGHRYFVPLHKIDYIRTLEGLESSFDEDVDAAE